jgi:hypothetical protein
MKIIISTKYFAVIIKRAVENSCSSFMIIPHTGEIVFGRLQNIVAANVHIYEHGLEKVETFTFHPIKMYELMLFLNKLSDQPIVIEFNQYTDTECEIKLSQFEVRF